jgi:hypothetical protein
VPDVVDRRADPPGRGTPESDGRNETCRVPNVGAGFFAEPERPVGLLQTTGIRSCSGRSASLAEVVTMVKLRMTEPSAPRQPSHSPAKTRQAASARAMAQGSLPSGDLPFIEGVGGHQAAAADEGVAEHRRGGDGLAAGVDRSGGWLSGP